MILAEDNRGDVMIIAEALDTHDLDVDLIVRRDGEEMLETIESIERGEMPCPDLVLLDLNLPKITGEALLRRMRQGSVCRSIPVVIVTSSGVKRDRETTLFLGANRYFRKPSSYDEYMELGQVIKELLGPTQ